MAKAPQARRRPRLAQSFAESCASLKKNTSKETPGSHGQEAPCRRRGAGVPCALCFLFKSLPIARTRTAFETKRLDAREPRGCSRSSKEGYERVGSSAAFRGTALRKRWPQSPTASLASSGWQKAAEGDVSKRDAAERSRDGGGRQVSSGNPEWDWTAAPQALPSRFVVLTKAPTQTPQGQAEPTASKSCPGEPEVMKHPRSRCSQCSRSWTQRPTLRLQERLSEASLARQV